MERDRALASLSHDHHQALVVAQKLRRATADSAAAFLAYWNEHGRNHVRQEEDVVRPSCVPHGRPRHRLFATERELLPLIEDAIPAPELAELARALA